MAAATFDSDSDFKSSKSWVNFWFVFALFAK
jgi:hypothetical protein